MRLRSQKIQDLKGRYSKSTKYHLVILFSNASIQVFCSFLNWIVYFFYWFLFIYPGISLWSEICIANILSHLMSWFILLSLFLISRHKGIYIVWFCFMKFKKQTKLICCNRSQTSANLSWVGGVLMTGKMQ